jgi:hypothetical protein
MFFVVFLLEQILFMAVKWDRDGPHLPALTCCHIASSDLTGATRPDHAGWCQVHPQPEHVFTYRKTYQTKPGLDETLSLQDNFTRPENRQRNLVWNYLQ